MHQGERERGHYVTGLNVERFLGERNGKGCGKENKGRAQRPAHLFGGVVGKRGE